MMLISAQSGINPLFSHWRPQNYDMSHILEIYNPELYEKILPRPCFCTVTL